MLHYLIIAFVVLFCAYELLPNFVLNFGEKIALKLGNIYESFDRKINLNEELSKEENFLDRALNKLLVYIPISKNRNKKVKFQKISNFVFRTIFLSIAFVVIVFWDIFWHMILKHFFNFLNSLKIYDRFSLYIKSKANKYFVLVVFLLLFVIMEYFGIYSAVLIASGNIVLAVIFYIAKFAMVFPVKVLYKEGHDKLVEIPWFLRRKNLLVGLLEWFETTSSFKKARQMLLYVKTKSADLYSKVKELFKRIKNRFKKDKQYRFIFEFKAYRRLLRMRKKAKANHVK